MSIVLSAILIGLVVAACALRFVLTMSREAKTVIVDCAEAVVAPFAAEGADELSDHDKAVARNKMIQTKMSMQSVGMAPASLARG